MDFEDVRLRGHDRRSGKLRGGKALDLHENFRMVTFG
jgi:hypothetical protein